jgi:hypothetical protein
MSSSEILIEELTGRKRRLVLRGAGLPKQGAAWGGKQRLVTTWYPGNAAQGTQQVLGPTESQSAWEGEWNTTRLIRMPCGYGEDGKSTGVVFADAIREIAEDMFRAGGLLRVTWASNPNREHNTINEIGDVGNPDPGTVSVVRLGRAIDWNFAYDRVDDIKWTITWEWTSRGPLQQKVEESRAGSGAADALKKLSDLGPAATEAAINTAAFKSTRTIPNSATPFSLNTLLGYADQVKQFTRQWANRLNTLSNRVNTIAGLINTTKNFPFEVANQALDIAQTMVLACNNFADAITRTPPELNATRNRAATVTQAAAYIKGNTDSANSAALTAAQQKQVIQRQVQSRLASGADGKGIPATKTGRKVLAVAGVSTQTQTHVVKSGETLLSISQKYFGVPDGAADIAYINGLPLRTPTLRPGKIIAIPTGIGVAPRIGGLVPRPPVAPSPGPSPQPNGIGTAGSQ